MINEILRVLPKNAHVSINGQFGNGQKFKIWRYHVMAAILDYFVVFRPLLNVSTRLRINRALQGQRLTLPCCTWSKYADRCNWSICKQNVLREVVCIVLISISFSNIFTAHSYNFLLQFISKLCYCEIFGTELAVVSI